MLFSLFWTAFFLIALTDVLSLTAILSQSELIWENNHTFLMNYFCKLEMSNEHGLA